MTDLRLMPTSSTHARHLPADISVDRSLTPGLALVSDLRVLPEVPAATRHVMALLAGGVPLSLLFDLVDPAGPPSADMVSSETDSRSLIGDLLAFRAESADRGVRRDSRLG